MPSETEKSIGEVEETASAPERPEWLNAAMIQDALRSPGGPSPDTVVTSVNFSKASAPGENYCSTMYRAEAQTTAGDTHHLLVKCLPEGEVMSQLMLEGCVFAKETHVFKRLLPEMQRLLGSATPQLAARCLLHRSDPSEVMVITDLGVEGFRMGDRHGGLDRAHSALALRALARFHAASYAVWKTSPELFEPLVNPFDNAMSDSLEKSVTTAMEAIAEEVSSWEYYPEYYSEKLLKLKDRIHPLMKEYNDFREGKFNVMSHSDFWVNNMMFRYDDGSKPADVRLLDFQMCHLGSPAIDVMFFRHTSVTEEVYFEHWPGLFREYHSTLSECMGALGYGADCPGIEELEAETRELGRYSLVAAFLWLPLIKLRKGRAFDVDKSVQGGSQSEPDVYSGPEYKRWLRQLLPVFECWGLLDLPTTTDS